MFFQCILFCSILVLHVKYISLSGRCHLTITQHLFCSLFCVGELLFTFVFPCFIQSSEFRYFVSKKWLTKFQSCMEPGNKSIAGRPLIDWFATGMYIIVSQMMLTSFLVCFYRAYYKLRLHVSSWRWVINLWKSELNSIPLKRYR